MNVFFIIAALLARIVLAIVFLWAGVAKARHYAQFRQSIAQHQLLPDSAGRCVARLLPYAEIGIAGVLLVGFAVRWAALCASLLLIGFILVTCVSLVRGLRVPCMCFGNANPVNGWWTLYRNGGLLVLAAALLAAPDVPVSLEQHLTMRSVQVPPFERALPVVALLVMVGVAWAVVGEGLRHGYMLIRRRLRA